MRNIPKLCSFLLILYDLLMAGASSDEMPASKRNKRSDNYGETNNCNDDIACLLAATQDRMGLDAIRALHQQLDDDADGAVDLSETQDFLREELKYEKGAEKRQKAFHRNDDMHISVKELWESWVKSEVHNWTVEQTVEWLISYVELPQYAPTFISNRVTGSHLPRLATTNGQYISNVLGIKDPVHKQKIALKAMDVVLFGPPKVDYNNFIKDSILVSLLVSALTGCYYAYRQSKNSNKHLQRMMKDMENLQKAETDLEMLQVELEKAKQEQEFAASEKLNLEKRLQDSSDVKNSNSDMEVSQLKGEIEILRNALQRAEGELVDRYWSPPPGLQLWLQLTHEIEIKSYLAKKHMAEKQLQVARDACEKLRKKRSSLVGAFVSTHGKSIDDVDRSILDARNAMNEVTQELAERVHRWKQIESLCGFSIINNKGLAYLESVLYRNSVNGRNLGFRGRMSSQDVVDDDAVSNYSAPAGEMKSGISTPYVGERSLALENFGTWGESRETSDSERGDKDDGEERSGSGSAHFILGSENPSHSPLLTKESQAMKNRLIKCANVEEMEETPEVNGKHSPPIVSLEHHDNHSRETKSPNTAALAGKKLSSSLSLSSSHSLSLRSTVDESDAAVVEEIVSSKKKSKLRFPKFGRRKSFKSAGS